MSVFRKHSTTTSGIVALVALTFIYGLTAVMARFFSDSVGIFEQWYIRFFVAAIVMLIVFHKKIRFNELGKASRKEHGLVAFRGLIGFVLGAGLYALSTQYASIGSVAVMQVVPITALFGWLILHEKVSRETLVLIIISFVGAVLVVMQSGIGIHFGLGEALSLLSGAFFSLTFVLRKKQTGEFNNYELAFTTTLYGFGGNYLIAVLTTGRILPPSAAFEPGLALLFIGAGILSVMMSLLSSYGFEHVKATTASVILDMELVFGIALGYLFYRELLTSQQLFGALMILFASGAIGYRDAKKQPIAPSPE